MNRLFNNESYITKTINKVFKTNSPLNPTPAKNAIILNAPETLFSNVTSVDFQFM
jgi:hypothetical protein